MSSMIRINDIELCFWDPTRDKPPDMARGVLYILRRDLVHLYGTEAEIPSAHHRSPMLATIGILTGLELMSKLATNDLSGDRSVFKKFLTDPRYGGLKEDEAEALYKLRCAQVHAYCLIDVDEKRKVTFQFVLLDTLSAADPLLQEQNPQKIEEVTVRTFKVNYWGLKRFFLTCVGNFETAVRNPDSTLINNFMNAMKSIGKVAVTAE